MEWLFASALVLLVTFGMALGMILRGRPLQTSCGGMACLPDDPGCAGCPKRQGAPQP